MADNDKPPAPPASADTSAPKATASASTEKPTDAPARAKAPEIERKHAEIYDSLAVHLLQANTADVEETHPRVHEHLELHGIKPVMEFDPIAGEMVMRPHWKARALLAWWKAHGLEHHSRISPQHFQAALHEALHGRI